ncbi:MAG: MFS transporter, partial [Candidatus Bathyarchaeia archaeon]
EFERLRREVDEAVRRVLDLIGTHSSRVSEIEHKVGSEEATSGLWDLLKEVKSLSKNGGGGEGWSFRRLLKTMSLLVVFHMLISLTVGASNSLLSIYASERFNASTTQVGFMFSIIGLATLVSQLSAAYVLKKMDLKRFLQLCILLMIPLYAFLPFVRDLNLFTTIYAISYGLYSATWPASATLVTMAIPSSKWNIGMGFRQTAVRLGFSLASMIAGLLWSSLGPSSVFYASSILAILTIVPLLLFEK